MMTETRSVLEAIAQTILAALSRRLDLSDDQDMSMLIDQELELLVLQNYREKLEGLEGAEAIAWILRRLATIEARMLVIGGASVKGADRLCAPEDGSLLSPRGTSVAFDTNLVKTGLYPAELDEEGVAFRRDENIAEAIPGRCWKEARVLGAAGLISSGDEVWRLRLGTGTCAALLFPDVPLSTAAAVFAQLSCESGAGHEVTGALALLPIGGHLPDDIAAAVEAASQWSPMRTLGTLSGTLTLALMPDGPALANILLILRHQGEAEGDFVVMSCKSVILLPRAGTSPEMPQNFFMARSSSSADKDLAFEDLSLDESYDSEKYRHLDLSILRLSDGSSVWTHVKFKLFENNESCGLEFRAAPGWPAIFRTWPGDEEDSFGQVYRINGAAGLAAAIKMLPHRSDRALLAALAAVLPNIVQTLATREVIGPIAAAAWLAVAQRMRQAELLPVP